MSLKTSQTITVGANHASLIADACSQFHVLGERQMLPISEEVIQFVFKKSPADALVTLDVWTFDDGDKFLFVREW